TPTESRLTSRSLSPGGVSSEWPSLRGGSFRVWAPFFGWLRGEVAPLALAVDVAPAVQRVVGDLLDLPSAVATDHALSRGGLRLRGLRVGRGRPRSHDHCSRLVKRYGRAISTADSPVSSERTKNTF